MYDILDFDANFAAYSEKWMQMNKKKFANIEQMEDAMPDVYMHWLNSPAAFLMGETPAAYFNKYDNPDDLVAWVIESEAAGVPVPDPLMERISDLGERSVPALLRTAAEDRVGDEGRDRNDESEDGRHDRHRRQDVHLQ